MFSWDVVTLFKCFFSLGMRKFAFVYLMLEKLVLPHHLMGTLPVNFSGIMLGLDVIFIYTITKLLPGT